MLATFKAFSGRVPRLGARLLSITQAQIARNLRLWSGELRPIKRPVIEQEITRIAGNPEYATLYSYENPLLGQSIWFANTEDLDYAKSPVYNDSKNRTVVTGLDVPRIFDADTILATTDSMSSDVAVPLAIEQPDIATLSKDGVAGGDPVATAYIYSWSRVWDGVEDEEDGDDDNEEKQDEGMPSDPAETAAGEVTIDIETGEYAVLSNIQYPAARTDITRITIYRSTVGATTSGYAMVKEFDIADGIAGTVSDVTYDSGTDTFTFEDHVDEEDLGDAPLSLSWNTPLDTLQGIVSLNNGVLAAFDGNDIYLTEPYQSHAWPEAYRQTVDSPVVGLGHYGNNLVVLTEARPVLLNVLDPANVIPVPFAETAPCVAKASIVNASDGCYYASTHGLLKASGSGLQWVTQSLFSKDDWAALNPSSFKCALFEGRMFTAYTKTNGDTGAFLMDFAESNSGVMDVDGAIEALYVQESGNNLFYVKRTGNIAYIWEWDAGDNNMDFIWKSKIIQTTTGPMNFSCAQIYGDFNDPSENIKSDIDFNTDEVLGYINAVPVNVHTLNGSYLLDPAMIASRAPYVLITFYSDGVQVYQRKVTSSLPFRLPSIFVGSEFEVQVQSNINVYRINLATSMQELSRG